jgi:hypothetical protein
MATLRWYNKRNAVSSQQIIDFAASKGIGRAQAKHELEQRTQPVLQCLDVQLNAWVDVPFVTLVTDPATGMTREDVSRRP